MKRKKMLGKVLVSLLIVAMFVQVASCGYYLYPERRGQKEGNLDWKIVALDALGLLFFIIPGVIAFSVDFTSNTIYLPSGKKSLNDLDVKEMLAIRVAPGELNKERIEAIVSGHVGEPVSLDSPDVRVWVLDSLDEIGKFAADANKDVIGRLDTKS